MAIDYSGFPFAKGAERTQPKRNRKREKLLRDVKAEVAKRPHSCECCGEPLPEPLCHHNFSHIKHRGMGGNPALDTYRADNFALICQGCHDRYPGKMILPHLTLRAEVERLEG